MVEADRKQIHEAKALVAGGEAGEAICAAIGIAGSGVAAGETVAVEGVQRELVDVDSPTEDERGGGEQGKKQEEVAVRNGGAAKLGLHAEESLFDDGGEGEQKADDEDRGADEGEHVEQAGSAGVRILCGAAGDRALTG